MQNAFKVEISDYYLWLEIRWKRINQMWASLVTSRSMIMGVWNMLNYFYFPNFLQYSFGIRGGKKSQKLSSNERRKELIQGKHSQASTGWGRFELVHGWRETKRRDWSWAGRSKGGSQAWEKGVLGRMASHQGEVGGCRGPKGSQRTDHGCTEARSPATPCVWSREKIKGMEESGRGSQQLLWGIRMSISNKWRDCREAPREGPPATRDEDLIPLPVNLLAAAKEEMCGLNPPNERLISRKYDPE